MHDVPAHRDARPDRRRRPGARHRRARHGHRQDRDARRRRRGARHRRLRQRLLPLDQRQGLQRHRDLAGAQARRGLRQSLLHADPSDLHPGERRLPVEAHADERVAAQRRPGLGAEEGRRHPPRRTRFPRPSATTTSSGAIPASATSRRATSRRAPPRRCATRAAASAPAALGVYLDFADAIKRLGADAIRERYGNLFEMYQRITDEDPYQVPMRIYPGGALHDGRALGGLQPDEHDPRAARDRRGELLRPRRQPARRERADAGAGRRLLRPAGHDRRLPRVQPSSRRSTPIASRVPPGRRKRRRCSTRRLLEIQGKRTVDSFHRELGKIMWDKCGMARNAAGLREALERIPGAARGVLAERERARQRRRAEPGAGEGRARGRLPGAGRADVPGRAAPRGVVRRPLPRGVSRRRTARRCATTSGSPTWPRGSIPARARRRGCTRSRSSSRTCTWRSGATSETLNEPDSPRLAAAVGRRRRARWCATRPATSAPTCRSSRCSTSSTSGSWSAARCPIAFDHDCREGICGSCGLMINGVAHGPNRGTATCQLHMRSFNDGDEIRIEPWRARAFPGRQRPGRGPRRARPDHRRRAATSARPPAARRTRTRSSFRSPTRTPRWTPPSASAAAPAWRRAPTARPRSSRRRRSPTWACCRRASPSGTTARLAWSGRWTSRASAAARSTASARRRARRRSASTRSPG